MSDPLLAIDAGNSRLKFGLFVRSQSSFYRRSGSTISRVVDVVGDWPSCRRFLAIAVDESSPWNTLANWQPSGVVIAGSNPLAVQRLLGEWPEGELPAPQVVRDRTAVPIVADVEFPEKVGLDRLLNAVAANSLRPLFRAAIVVDSGTATTVDLVSANGAFCGGAILPGLEMSAKALHHYTALLPLLPVQDLGGETPVLPGRNTREAMRNGLFWGQVGAIRELVRQLCHQNGLDQPDMDGVQHFPNSPWLILTGGGEPVLSTQFPGFLTLPSLGMHGLVLTVWNKGL